MRWRDIADRLEALDVEEQELRSEWEALRAKCAHVKLPQRKLGEQYGDRCPDCGFYSYCVRIGL